MSTPISSPPDAVGLVVDVDASGSPAGRMARSMASSLTVWLQKGLTSTCLVVPCPFPSFFERPSSLR